jgi:hypothetical protein
LGFVSLSKTEMVTETLTFPPSFLSRIVS